MPFNLYNTLKDDLDINEVEKTISVIPQLSQKDYGQVKSILNRLGGKWISSAQHFQFCKNPQLLIERVLSFGSRKLNRFHFYPTPNEVFDYMTAFTPLSYFGASQDSVKVLEPSAGEGSLIGKLKEFGLQEGRVFEVEGYDIDPLNVMLCQESGYNVTEADFLQIQPVADYDLVIMNPPFNGDEFIKHIQHAQKFIKPGGLLISVVPTGWITSAHGNELRTWLLEQAQIDSASDLESGNFFEPGTYKGVSISTTVISLRSVSDAAKSLASEEYKSAAVHSFDFFIDNHNKHYSLLQDLQNDAAPESEVISAIENIVSSVMQDASNETTHIPRRYQEAYSQHLLRLWFPDYAGQTTAREPHQTDFFDVFNEEKAA